VNGTNDVNTVLVQIANRGFVRDGENKKRRSGSAAVICDDVSYLGLNLRINLI